MAIINKTGITNGGTIHAEHVTRVIDALSGVATDTIIATGSFSGSFKGDGSQLSGVSAGFPFTGSARVTGSLIVTGSINVYSPRGSINLTEYASAVGSSSMLQFTEPIDEKTATISLLFDEGLLVLGNEETVTSGKGLIINPDAGIGYNIVSVGGTFFGPSWTSDAMFAVSGSISCLTILTIKPQHPLPNNAPTGSFAVSASNPPVPYFWNGSTWNALY